MSTSKTQPTHEHTIDRCREQFPSIEGVSYLLSHSLGPLPRSVPESLNKFCAHWQEHKDEDAWARQWWELATQVGDSYGRIIGAPAGTVVPTPNATLAMATVASCLRYKDRSKVITTALDFPSMGYLWHAQEALGAQIIVIPSDDGISIDSDALLDAIDEQTSLVAVSHVSFRSSYRINPHEIVTRAQEKGAMTLFDVYQSAGITEIDAIQWGADFLVGGSIKWLCGGPSCGYLYVRQEKIPTLDPMLTGWFAHQNPFAFAYEPTSYDTSIRRFANGTTSIPALYTVLPGLKLIESVGVERIAKESRQRTQMIVEHALTKGWKLNSPTNVNERGGTVMIDVDDPEQFAQQLRTHNVHVDWRPGVGIRLSPHFFNTDEEIHHALDRIASVLASTR
jgi:kynureninase